MIQEQKYLTISIQSKWGPIELYIEPNSDKDKLYIENDLMPGESPYHLLEGCNYRYELTGGQEGHDYRFEDRSEIVYWQKGQRHPNQGNLKTGIYVGTLKLKVIDITTEEPAGDVELEIRSVKTDYQTDYRTMLNEIAEYYTDLVLQQGSPVTQKLEIDNDATYTTLYQKFSFIRSIVEGDAFAEAVHKIITNPVRKWSETTVRKNIVGVKRLSRQNMRQVASATDRMAIPVSWQGRMPAGLTSVPRQLDVTYKEDSVDNQENQFVKFALRNFMMFCAELRTKKNCTTPLINEIDHTIDVLNSYLDNKLFREVSMPSHLNLNSPVLQRKEGYREVLQAWLIFDMAAKLSWHGGDDIYDAGKKNVATLYEYWLFFKLMELIGELFNLEVKDKAELVKTDNDNINLDLIQGRVKMIHGKHETASRTLNIAFYYNRTFSKVPDTQDPIHSAGSWTMTMRPDYTLSMWPGDIDEKKAEQEELITHIHLDAKYRLNRILLEDEVNTEDEENTYLLEEKKQQELGIYKRADLLKMHAYKDAIRRTSGAYVLYPGDVNKAIRGFHEIVPGLGAFCIRPGHFREDSIYLRQFLAEVKAHLLDRTSEREKLSFYQYDVYKEANPHMVMDKLPEPTGNNRNFLPDETHVLIGFCAPYNKEFVTANYIYNVRTGDQKGALDLTELMKAQYALVWNQNGMQSFHKINKRGFKIYSAQELVAKGYTPTEIYKKISAGMTREEAISASSLSGFYTVVSFNKNGAEKEFQNIIWDTRAFSMTPYVIKLTQLLKFKK